MDMLYEAYSYADRLFYNSPVRWGAVEQFAAAIAPLPDGWQRTVREVWAGLQPKDLKLPEQGWKIHVSARPDNAEHVLTVVHDYCIEQGVAFKFLRSPALVHTQSAKYAARGSSGKFLTLYPVGVRALEHCLGELGAALAGQPGPYILSDLRWGKGPLYLRYGGFTEQFCRSETGELVLALREPSGRLRPDVRRAVFDLPAWAPVPAVLETLLAERDADVVEDFPYTVERALHFSNGGGIYLAAPADGGERVVLKEARPHAGLDQRGVDAVTRLGYERDILQRLAGLDAVPAVYGYLTAWEHDFLVQEYIEGEPLNLWFGRRYPLVRPDADAKAVAGYRREALGVLAQVRRTLDAIHERGVVFGDLHPRNLIVRPDGRVAFIDFELSSPVDAFVRPALGAAGFAAPAGTNGFAVDEYALAALTVWCFLPLLPLTALDAGKIGELIEAARERFALPPRALAAVRERLTVAQGAEGPGAADASGTATAARTTTAANASAAASSSTASTGSTGSTDGNSQLHTLLSGRAADWPALRDSLVAGIMASATPERPDRLFPGDPGQFTHDGLGLAYGASGVLHALHTVGAPIAPDHAQWLVDAVRRNPIRPGLFLGSHGVALTLQQLGFTETALSLLDRLTADRSDEPGTDLASGLPGIGLTLLHFCAEQSADKPDENGLGESGLLDEAVAGADRLAWALRLPSAVGRPGAGSGPDLPTGVGLMHGAAGAALFFVRLFERTGDTALLDLAREALERDLERCIQDEDGTLQVDDDTRVLPYIESGSAGIGLALHAYLAHRPDPEPAQRQELIRRAAQPEFIVQSGLFNGRAGLIAYLALLRDSARGARAAEVTEPADGTAAALNEVIRRHVRRLSWHLIPYQGHLAFPGEQLLRLSMDLATGSAGVLLGVGAALAGLPALPFWTPASAGPSAASGAPANASPRDGSVRRPRVPATAPESTTPSVR